MSGFLPAVLREFAWRVRVVVVWSWASVRPSEGAQARPAWPRQSGSAARARCAGVPSDACAGL